MVEIHFIEQLLSKVSPYVQSRYQERSTLEVTTKSNSEDLLTEVDLEVQRQLTTSIQRRFPEDQVIGEEFPADQVPDDPQRRCWIIDPIDGTQNFLRGLFPAFGVSLAFAEHGHVQAGGVLLPIAGQLFLAQREHGASSEGLPLRVSETALLANSRCIVDLGSGPARPLALDRFAPVMSRAGQVRSYNAAVIGLLSVATGDADAYFNVGLSVWDYAAAMLAVEEAGGRVTRLDGTPIRAFANERGIVASNGVLHDQALAMISR